MCIRDRAAIDHAAALEPRPTVLVLDGPLRIRGVDGVISLLAVDANRPWGSGRLPPAGDLRASREVLLACADQVVPVDAHPSRVRLASGEVAPLASLRGMTVGLFTAIARPDRLVRSLVTAGIRPHEIVSVADHGAPPEAFVALEKVRVDTWLATEKCALHLARASARQRSAAPITILEDVFVPPPALMKCLANVPFARSSSKTWGSDLHGAP